MAKAQPVTMYNETTGEFQYFKSIGQAAKYISKTLDPSIKKRAGEVRRVQWSILECIKTGFIDYGSSWRFDTKEPAIYRTKVFGKDKGLVIKYKDLLEAGYDVWAETKEKSVEACISNCINGRLKTAYGYQWRYAD